MDWPNGMEFAFTIIDDTDGSTVDNTKPVYDYLFRQGIAATKTVWVYSSRDGFPGDSLEDEEYRTFVQELQRKGFELASHGPGSGDFLREEYLESFKKFKEWTGMSPNIFINHAFNKGNLYWGAQRFSPPVAALFRLGRRLRNEPPVPSQGEIPDNPFYWGDYAKVNLSYMRNLVFTGLDTLKSDPWMPYREHKKEGASNHWFSSSDGYDCSQFNRLLDPENVRGLARRKGCAIVYTHFGYGFVKDGVLDPVFQKRIDYLARQKGWFVPASILLDYLLNQKKEEKKLSRKRKFLLDCRWLWQRGIRRLRWRV